MCVGLLILNQLMGNCWKFGGAAGLLNFEIMQGLTSSQESEIIVGHSQYRPR